MLKPDSLRSLRREWARGREGRGAQPWWVRPAKKGGGAGRARGEEKEGEGRACERVSYKKRERARRRRPPPKRGWSEAVRSAAFQ